MDNTRREVGETIKEFGRPNARYADRADAGRALAAYLGKYKNHDVLVLGIPRGGVPVAAEVARALQADLDVIVARKLGAPGQPELAIGAVTSNGGRFFNDETIEALGVTDEYLEHIAAVEMDEAHRRERMFRNGRAPERIEGRVVTIVDDGLATGATMRASVRSVRRRNPAPVHRRRLLRRGPQSVLVPCRCGTSVHAYAPRPFRPRLRGPGTRQ